MTNPLDPGPKQHPTYRTITFLDLAKQALGDYPDDFLGNVLWNCTAYPFADATYIAEQLAQAKVMMDCGLSPFEVCDQIMWESMKDA